MELNGTLDLRRDATRYGNAQKILHTWIKVVKEAEWEHLMDVRLTYRNADFVNGKTIFNIKGNHYRLITIIDYSLQLVVYEAFMTHNDYNNYHF